MRDETANGTSPIWTRLHLLLLSLLLSVLGILVLCLPYAVIGIKLPPLSAPVAAVVEAVGIALFLTGSVSFAVQEVIRHRTQKEFERQLRFLLGTTKDSLTHDIRSFLGGYLTDLGQRIEELGIEMHGSRIKDIYSSREKGIEAMGRAIRDADKFVYLMGISLRQFFAMDTEASRALSDVYDRREDIAMEGLILDNRSAEALDRSAREEGMKDFSNCEDPEYQKKNMFFDTESTMSACCEYFTRLKLHLYDRQSLFLLITDKTVFMEPYHYGDRRASSGPPHLKRLAELVPLIEFEKTDEQGPYEQLHGHFRYMFDEKSKEVPVNESYPIREHLGRP